MINDLRANINIRVDAELSYLLGLASQATGKSLTDYIKDAVRESFKNVSIDPYPEMGEEAFTRDLSKDEIIEKANKRKNAPVPIERSLHKAAEALWTEKPFNRLAMLYTLAPHLMNSLDKAMWDHVLDSKQFKMKDGKLNYALINEQWDEILEDVSDSLIASAKRKAKGHD